MPLRVEAIEVNARPSAPEIPVRAATRTIETRAMMSAYSTRVWPSSSFRIRNTFSKTSTPLTRTGQQITPGAVDTAYTPAELTAPGANLSSPT